MRVLLVEDEADIADALLRFLQAQGHAVDLARDVADAEAALARAERRFWKSFGFEALAIGALLAALWLLSSSDLLAPLAGPAHWGLAPPLLLIVALWFGGTRRLRQV